MIAKKQQGLLYVFEQKTGMTAVFFGRELAMLEGYVRTGEVIPFIQRLYELGIFVDGSCRKVIKQAMQQPEAMALQALHIELTGKCPLTCPQCYKNPGKGNEMQLAVFARLVKEAEQLKVFQIALGGGEPLVYPYLLEAVKLVKTTQMAVSITSSGYGLTGALLDKLLAAGLNHLQISLNSLDEKTNNLSRDGYNYAVSAIKLLAGSSISFGINYVARQDNLAGFDKLAAYACACGADNINVLRYKPSCYEDFQKQALTVEQTKQLAQAISTVKGVRVKVDSAYSQLLAYLHQAKADLLRCGCGAGRDFLAVTPTGQFSPCSHLPMAEPSASIAAYLSSQQLKTFQAGQAKLTGLCGSCCYGSMCGGCRAVCLAVSGQLTAGEQACLAFKEV